MGRPGTDTLQRLSDLVIEQHPVCGHAAALLTVRADAPDAVERIVEILQPTDERFARRMRRLEDSPFGQRFSSIPEGAARMGRSPVLASALAATTIAALDGPTPHLDRLMFWNHAIAVGALAMVGAGLDRAHAGEAFPAAFFSTIGRLVLARYAPDAFGRAVSIAEAEHTSLGAAVQHVFGFPESELAGSLALRWHFPAWLADTIAFPVRDREVAAQAHTLGGLVYRAELVARARGFGPQFEGIAAPPDHLRWLTDPLLLAFDRAGGTAWLERAVGGIFAIAVPDGDEGRAWR